MSQILINEVYPNPESGSEWIEFITTEELAEDFSLINYTIFDSYHQIYKFSGDEEFNEQILVVEISGLNNDTDSVVFKDAEGNVLNSFTYTETSKGLSWAREINSDIFSIGQASPNAINPTLTPSPSPTVEVTLATTPSTTSTPTGTIIPTVTPTDVSPTPKINKEYHNYDLSKIKLKSQEKTFTDRAGQLAILAEEQGQAEILSAIIGSSLIIVSALFLIYVKVKSQHH